MENHMKTILAVFALTIAATGSSLALPVAPLTGNSDVIQVAGGCGPGYHRGPRGGCLRNFARPALHACPRGYHLGPGGRCRANW